MPTKDTLTILFFGDIVGKPGRRALAAILPDLKKELHPDLTIANAENLAHGVGVTQKTLDECMQAGINFFTSGNHIWKKPVVENIFKSQSAPLLRPANYPTDMPGYGHQIVNIGEKKLLVVNLNGKVFIEDEFTCPFHAIDAILDQYSNDDYAGVFVDFHAEATSEKIAFGWYTDGRITAMLGTHTHIVTADETVLPQGTAYQTDVGMVGLKESVIGVDKDIIIEKFLTGKSKAHDIPEHGNCIVNATMITIDPQTRKALSIKRIFNEVTV